jgi:thiamine biosynthesis lipoprotein
MGCSLSGGDKVYHFTRFAMDCAVEYTVVTEERSIARNAVQKAHNEIDRIESLLWEGNPSSTIFRFNHSHSGVLVDRETFEFITRAKAYANLTAGAFDISIQPMLELYDFTHQEAVPPTDDALRQRVALRDLANLELRAIADHRYHMRKKNEIRLAVGGIAKGYGVDRAIKILKTHGIKHALINAGGDLYCLGNKFGKSWWVGVQHPRKPNDVIEVVALKDQAVATSGDYQRYFIHQGKRYHHILDPLTGRPAPLSQSATVIAETTERADALATASFVLGSERGIRLLNTIAGVEGMIIDAAGRKHYSRGFFEFIVEEKVSAIPAS